MPPGSTVPRPRFVRPLILDARRCTLAALVAVLSVAAARPVLAQPVQGDQINTSGRTSGGNIVADAQAWWANPTGHTDEFRTQTGHCRDLLDEAEGHRQTAMRYKAQAKARGPMSSQERTRLNRLGNDEYAIVTRLVRRFYECARPTSDRINTRSSPRQQPAPQKPQPGRPDRTGTGDQGRPQPKQPAPQQAPGRSDRIDTGDETRPPGDVLSTGGSGSRRAVPNPSQGRTPPPPRPPNPRPQDPQNPSRPPGQPYADRIETICDLQRLAALVFERYHTKRPIARWKVTNATSPTYLLTLSGMEWERLGQGKNTVGQLWLGWANMQGFDAYRAAIMDAVVDLPPGTNLIIVGHSQGGMEAQNVVRNLVERWGYRVPMVISYGAPITTTRREGTGYLHVRAPDDGLQGLDRRYNLSAREIILSNRGTADPHVSYPTDQSGLRVYRVPSVSVLKTPCYEIDLTTVKEFFVQDLFKRFFGPPAPRALTRTPLNPESGLHGGEDVNCFWVSLAWDRFWATGLPVPARCETRPTRNSEIPPVLIRQYGDTPLDDLHGPSPADGHARHRDGEMVDSDRGRIEHALGSNDPKAHGRRGLIFVWESGKIGHVFNARNVQGRIQYWDEQKGNDARFWLEPSAGVRLKFYRTN